jgi:polyisoprenoid-binding protein YceI
MKTGEIVFTSDAPLEEIKAKSSRLLGIMDIAKNRFAFSVDILSFQGFNSELQREHFGENYMETDKFPKATFQGKIIDKFNPALAKQNLRVKGQFEVHGVSQERIIEVEITKSGEGYRIHSAFNVQLADHNIAIPKIVYQKIAEIIHIDVSGTLKPRE